MLEFLKNYYIFMLVLLIFSYLVPKEEYKTYIQFFISIFMIVLLLKPILTFFATEDFTDIYRWGRDLENRIDNLDMQMQEGENLFEYFFFEGKGE